MRPNTGRNDGDDQEREKIAGVTSRAASAASFSRSRDSGSWGMLQLLCAPPSTMTISASTVAPMAIAIPPSDMIVAECRGSTWG